VGRDDFDPLAALDRNPYEAPHAPIDPAPPVRPVDSLDVGPGALSVRHDLTDADLRLWLEFEFPPTYDPMPAFGFVPKWVMWAAAACCLSPCMVLICNASPVLLAVGTALTGLLVAAGVAAHRGLRRRAVRRAGYCDGRTLTVGPGGLTLTTGPIEPGGGESFGLGAAAHPWGDFWGIRTRDDSIFFWRSGPKRRRRLVVPLRAFATRNSAAAFFAASSSWHAAATAGIE